jgi:hypothetical protein
VKPQVVRVVLSWICCAGLAAGCSSLRPAGSLDADEHHVCRAGSALKYRKPLAVDWPQALLPRPPAGGCMHR